MLTLTYEYKILPKLDQVALIEEYLDVCRKVWNYALRERKDWSSSRKCAANACSQSVRVHNSSIRAVSELCEASLAH